MGADTVKYGVPNAGDAFGDEGLILDAQNNNLYTFGKGNQPSLCQSTLETLLAQTALTSITTAQTLLSYAFNAGALNAVGKTIVVDGYGIYTSPGTTAPVLTFTLSLGGVTLATITTGALSTTASTNMPFQFEFVLTVASAGTAGTIETHGEVDINLTANTPAGALSYYPDTNSAVSSAVNLAIAETLTLTIAASSVLTSAQLRSAYIQQAA